MNDSGNNTMECFASFGRTIYMVQALEKGILNSLLASYGDLTKTRFDELFFEKSQLTVGQLKREIIEKGIFSDEIIMKIEKFHEKRDWLTHNYWWDRTIEFSRDDLRHKIFEELDILNTEFYELNKVILEKNNQILINKGLNPEQLVEEFSELDKTPENPIFRKLSKNETLIGIYIFEPEYGFQIPIFELEDHTYWTLCESGLTFFILEDINYKLKPLDKTIGVYPVKQFNPRPKIKNKWEYELDLKKDGLLIKVNPAKINGKFVFKWSI